MKTILLLVVATIGCASRSGANGGSGGARTQIDGAVGAGGTPGIGAQCQKPPPTLGMPEQPCDTVANVGAPWITSISHATGAESAIVGGTLTDGVYVGTALDIYRGSLDVRVRDTVYVSQGGTKWAWANQAQSPSNDAATSDSTVTTNESLVVYSGAEMYLSCGTTTSPVLLQSSLQDTVGFTVTPTGFLVYSLETEGPLLVETFSQTSCPPVE